MKRAAPFLVLLAAVLPCLNALGGGFVSDAGPMFQPGAALVSSREWAAWLGRDYYWGTAFQDVTLYRPLTVFSFLAHLRTTGLDPRAFLAGNVLLHGAVSLLVLLLGRRLVGATAALAGALVFAVHPIHTEAVAWVMGRAELLAALFAVATCILFWRATDLEERRRWPFAIGSVLAFFAALCSKEHVILLPLWLALASLVDRRRARRPALFLVAGSAAAAGIFLLLRAAALTRAPEMILDRGLFNPAAVVDWPSRWLTAASVIARYAKLLVWPVPLSHDYSYAQIPASASVGALEILGIGLVIGSLVATILALTGRLSAAALTVSFAALTLLPVSNLPFAIGTVMAERLVYLPSVGIALLAGWLFARLPLKPVVSHGVLATIVVLLAWRTVERNPVWKDDYSLYSAALAASPRSAQAHVVLAELELARGNPARAVELARQALRLFPVFYSGHVALAKGLVAGGQLQPAADEIRKALPLAPHDDRIRAQLHNNLAVVLGKLGHTTAAEAQCREAIRLAPDDLAPRVALIELLRLASRPAEAQAELREAMRVRPYRPAQIYPLAAAALALGELESARELARRAAEAGVAVPPEFYRALGR